MKEVYSGFFIQYVPPALWNLIDETPVLLYFLFVSLYLGFENVG